LKYWDSSAPVALHSRQVRTQEVRTVWRHDNQVLTWILSDVEMRSAIARLGREGAMAPVELAEAVRRVEAFWQSVHMISLSTPVKIRAKRLLSIQPIRAADALQLGAALTGAYDDPSGWEFVCLEARLGEAAALEGFTTLP
jgi:predicted nucleic acid-binding protein